MQDAHRVLDTRLGVTHRMHKRVSKRMHLHAVKVVSKAVASVGSTHLPHEVERRELLAKNATDVECPVKTVHVEHSDVRVTA